MNHRGPAEYKWYLAGLILATAFVAFGDERSVMVWGVALLLTGLALLINPPLHGLGRVGDGAVLGLLALPLLSFLPIFHWPVPDWRILAIDSYGIPLPVTLSVQPWASFEGYVCLLAGICFFYIVRRWPINLAGRRRLLFGFSLLLIGLAGWVVFQHLTSHSESDESGYAEVFFEGNRQRAYFLALGGVAMFAYLFEGLRSRLAMPLFGVAATILCFVALYMGKAGVGLLVYYVGLFGWLVWNLRVDRLRRSFKIAVGTCLAVAASFFFVSDLQFSDLKMFSRADYGERDRVAYVGIGETFKMVADSPFSGFGLNASGAVLIQYVSVDRDNSTLELKGGDFSRGLAELGGLVLVSLGAVLMVYFKRCRGLSEGGSRFYRRLSLWVFVTFLVLALFGQPGRSAGVLFLGIVFAALALPKGAGNTTFLKPWQWRFCGLALFMVGVVWALAGVTNWPFHSAIALERVQREITEKRFSGDSDGVMKSATSWIRLRPLEWRAYSLRAQAALVSGVAFEEAAADFERARFLGGDSAEVLFTEGLAWAGKDPERALAAWEIVLSGDVSGETSFFSKMLKAANSPRLIEGLAGLSELDLNYRSELLLMLRGEDFMRELNRDLVREPDLSQFSAETRSRIVENWIEHGDLQTAREFVDKEASNLYCVWWLRSLLAKNEADFREAVRWIREYAEKPVLRSSVLDELEETLLARQFSTQPRGYAKGMKLMSLYLQRGDYPEALLIANSMIETRDGPAAVAYWAAESLYHLGDFIESWYAFEAYLRGTDLAQ